MEKNPHREYFVRMFSQILKHFYYWRNSIYFGLRVEKMLYCDKYLLNQSKVSEYASVHFPQIYDDDDENHAKCYYE